MEQLRLIVGLGNPGAEYARTRHNAGFLLLDRLAEQWGARWTEERGFRARLAWAAPSDLRVLLCQPQTFMNASGEAVVAVAGFYRVTPDRLLVAVDDADLPLGEIRLRPGGGSGGHHGLESLARHLGTTAFARLRLGIGRRPGAREITDHVLGRFDEAELSLFQRVLERAAQQANCWVVDGIDRAMNDFNGVVAPSETEGNET